MLKNIKVYFLIVLIAVICYHEAHTVSYRDRVIGCLYSDVCSINQVCFDDNAFGRCEPSVGESPTSDYTYQLDRKTLQLLEKELDRLTTDGFGWNDAYTQCILKTVLNDRPRVVYDPSRCDSLRLPVPYVDLLITEPSESNNEADSDFLDENEAAKFLKLTANSPELSEFLSIAPANARSHKQSSKIGQSNKAPSFSFFSSSNSEPTLTSQNDLSQPNSLSSISPPISQKVANSFGSQTSDSIQKAFAATSTGSQNNGKPKQLSSDAVKSRLRSKHLKRTPSLRFVGKSERQEDAEKPNDGDRVLQSSAENAKLDRIVEMLMEKLKTEVPTKEATKELPNQKYSKPPVQTVPDGYFEYSVDSDAPYIGNVFADRKYDQPPEDDTLETLVRTQLLEQQQPPLGTPVFAPKQASSSQRFTPDETSKELDDDGRDEEPVFMVPFGRIFDTTNRPIKPEVRVLRDTNEEEEDFETPNSSQSDNEGVELLAPAQPDQGVVILDVIEQGQSSKSAKEREDEALLLKTILENLVQQHSGNPSEKVVIENIEELFADDNGEDGDGEDDDKINVKEILFGDINYNNKYDAKMPNFYRKHRYDIKKPGPKYYEEYFFKPDAKETSDEEDGTASNEPLFLQSPVKLLDEMPIMVKKDNNIRSNKPVSEGPVKVEAQSENAVVIRSAEVGEETSLEAVDSTHTYVVTDKIISEGDSQKFVKVMEQLFKLPRGTFSNLRKDNYQITFKVNPNYRDLNASQVATQLEEFSNKIHDRTGYRVKETGIGDKIHLPVVSARLISKDDDWWWDLALLILTLVSLVITSAFIIFLVRRNDDFRDKVKGFVKISEDWVNFDYQDLCRQRMKGKSGDQEEKDCAKAGSSENGTKLKNVDTNLANQEKGPDMQPSPPSRSSTSSWVEEPVSTNMEITTGHIILTYMEDHLKKKDRLDQEWEALCAYEADPCSTNAANQKQNANKNRYPDILPFDHSRVILNDLANANNSDYINANTITDHDPRNPAYIVTQGPLANTKADFWQMIWEQGSVIIIMLTRLRENGLNLCDRYWPEEGSEAYQDYEVHLVSEHIWCDDYLVRSFYLKNLKTSETRTVTQFHFLSWPENGIPPNTKSILDFRRKVNKSYKGRSCPIVVHCSDGIGRSGTYILIDMVLNRLAKGAKEIDIAATLEHIRDQRSDLVKNKAQFEFVLLAITEEVQAILKAIAPKKSSK